MGEDAEFVALYASELADLTFNSKPAINTLTMLAAENVRAAPSIAAAIERHVATVETPSVPGLCVTLYRPCNTSYVCTSASDKGVRGTVPTEAQAASAVPGGQHR